MSTRSTPKRASQTRTDRRTFTWRCWRFATIATMQGTALCASCVLREDRGDVRFANEVFVGSALAAMTLKKAGLHTAAREQAERALRMTTVGSLGIRNAPDMGMVRPEHADVVAMMRRSHRRREAPSIKVVVEIDRRA